VAGASLSSPHRFIASSFHRFIVLHHSPPWPPKGGDIRLPWPGLLSHRLIASSPHRLIASSFHRFIASSLHRFIVIQH